MYQEMILVFMLACVLSFAYAVRLRTCRKCGGMIDTYNGKTWKCIKCGERQ